MLSRTSKTICNSRFCTDYVRVKGKSFHHKGNVNNVTQANTPRLHSLSTTSSSPMTGTENSNKEQKKLKIPVETPHDVKRDWIGPPNSKSNLRPIKYFIPKDETKNEENYRHLRQETHAFNQEFWAKHNENFVTLRDAYRKATLKEKADRGERTAKLSAEEMAQFYRKFLDDNYKLHSRYNREWYKRNITLLWPAFKVTVERFFKGRFK